MTTEELIERQATYDYSDHFDHRFIQYCPVCGLESIQEYHDHNRGTYSCCNCGADNNVQAEFGDK